MARYTAPHSFTYEPLFRTLGTNISHLEKENHLQNAPLKGGYATSQEGMHPFQPHQLFFWAYQTEAGNATAGTTAGTTGAA